jgi:hypothetical protein
MALYFMGRISAIAKKVKVAPRKMRRFEKGNRLAF